MALPSVPPGGAGLRQSVMLSDLCRGSIVAGIRSMQNAGLCATMSYAGVCGPYSCDGNCRLGLLRSEATPHTRGYGEIRNFLC